MPLDTGAAPATNVPRGTPVPHVSSYVTRMSTDRYVVVMGPVTMGLPVTPLVPAQQGTLLQTVERHVPEMAHPSCATDMVHVPTGNALATQTEPTVTGPPMLAVIAKHPTTALHVNCNAPCLVDLFVPGKEPVVRGYQEPVPARAHLVGLDPIALPLALEVAITHAVDMVLATQ